MRRRKSLTSKGSRCHAPSRSWLHGALVAATAVVACAGVALSAPSAGASGPGPVVTAVDPGAGSATGGTPVVVTGSGFTGATEVDFGTTPSSGVSVTSDSSLTAIAPPGFGTVDVTVFTPSGDSAASPADRFTYAAGLGETWGDDSAGELGNGSINVTPSTAPAAVPNLGPVAQVAGGNDFSLALTTVGTVEAWGANSAGQLGNGTTGGQFASPAPVLGPTGSAPLSGIVAVAAGYDSAYALTAAGEVYAWGDGGTGQLGDGTTTSSNRPQLVVGTNGSGALSGVVAVSAGAISAYALLDTGAEVAWGSNAGGELASPTLTQSDEPVTVPGPGGTGTLAGVQAISAGYFASYALLGTGQVVSWGLNFDGQLGTGSTANQSATPELVSGLSGVTAVAGGAVHALALLATGQVEAWGDDSDGELGNGSTGGTSDVPVAVTGLPAGVTALSAGGDDSLAVVGGSVEAWGDNATGALGTGSTTTSAVPVPVPGLSGVTDLASGWSHTLALAQVTPTVTGLTGALPEVWLFALGGLFIFVTLFLPAGIIGAFRRRERAPLPAEKLVE